MNILFLTEDFPPMTGGIAVFLSKLCTGLARRGNKIRILASQPSISTEYDSEQLYSIVRYRQPRRLSSLYIGYQVVKQILKKKPDILFLGHVFGSRGLAVLLVSLIFRIPFVILIHGGHLPLARVSKINNIAVFSLLRHAKYLIANSKYTKSLLIEKGFSNERIKILNPGVDTDYFSPSRDKQEVNKIKKSYCDLNKALIVNVARLVPKKNHIRLIMALSEIIKKGKPIKCIIAGDGPERKKINRAIESLELHDEITLAGYLNRNKVRDLFRSADIVAMPSTLTDGHHESFGIAAIEAASCGKPVIVGSIGGQADTVIHEKTGFVVDADNTIEIEQVLNRLIENRILAKQMGEAGRKRTIQEFSWERIALKAEKMLENLISERTQP